MTTTRRSIASPLRRHRRRIAAPLSAILLAGLLVAGCSSGLKDAPRASTATPASGADIGLLFSVIAPSMDVVTEGDGFRLSVASTSPTAWFTDRPERRSGSFDVADLVSIWSAEQFDTDPPNAAIVVSVDGEQRQHVVELSDPRATDTKVSFHATDVGNDDGVEPVANRSATHDMATGSYGESELFIDNGAGPPCASSISDTNFLPCLIPANGKVTFKATTTRSDQYAQIYKPEPQDANSYGSFTIAATATTSQNRNPWGPCTNPCILQYFSGQTWTVQAGSVAVNFTVGYLPQGGGGGGAGGDGCGGCEDGDD